MSQLDYRPQDADIDIGRIFAALWRDKVRILLGTLVLTVLVVALLSMVTPKYEADARLLIQSSESIFTRPERDGGNAPDASLLDQEGVASQVEILSSSDLLIQVANELDLKKLSEFDAAPAMSGLERGLVALGMLSDPALVPPEKRVLDAVRERLEVYAVPDSRVIVIGFRSQDKELAARFPNALAEAYLALESRNELASTGRAATYLASEIEELQRSVREAEAAVAAFRSSSDLLIGQNDSILATQQLTELASELSRVRAARASAEARARSVKAALDNGGSLDAIPEVVESALIARLREREIALNAEIAELSTTLLPGHPRIQGLRSQLEDLSRQIRAEGRKVLVGLQNAAEIARSRENELMADLNELKAASGSASEREVELRALEREADSQRALLESYLVRFREAQSRDEGQYAPAKARLISRAIVPVEPAFPKMTPMAAAAFFVSLLIMILSTVVRELATGRAFVPAVPAEVAFRAGPMAAVEIDDRPPTPGPDDTPATGPDPVESASGANDNYDISALAGRLIDTGADRAIIVSPEGDAAAGASVGVARALADDGLRTILVDLTGNGAASRRMLEDANCPGITDLLASSSSYSDVIYPDFLTNAHVVPTGTADPVRAMRAADRLPIILDALMSAYDIVVVECGPTDAAGLKRLAGEGTQVALSVVDATAPEIMNTAGNLVDGGYDDLILVAAGSEEHDPYEPEPRRAYAR
ncbi:GumC family protein [Oricola cellulosilytica]|uniref:Chain-length determining protein n=1 Tax=Oricola cellulosilytica TaxID=1429082 RepID=A0A4R0PAY0_9HYPH|nr:Wzz/FepE/Etk N-terminal domain-containing protein [Oricola cellulosilytica]TCD14402.1 chain-length determining protein [Oricola cellulosilytica]